MISSDFYLYLPTSFDFRKIHRLLADPMFAGNPPDLSMESGPKMDEKWVVAFKGGSGAGWGISSHQEAALHIKKKVQQGLAVIETVERLDHDYKYTGSFKTLQTALHEAYAAY